VRNEQPSIHDSNDLQAELGLDLRNNLLVPGSFMKHPGIELPTTLTPWGSCRVHGRASAAADSISSPTSLLWAVSSV
jgi:hypothetical protein